jgi:hypothetical protein
MPTGGFENKPNWINALVIKQMRESGEEQTQGTDSAFISMAYSDLGPQFSKKWLDAPCCPIKDSD